MEAGKSKVKVLADLVLGEGPLPDSQMTVISLCAHLIASRCIQRERETGRLTERGEGFPDSSVGKESTSHAQDPGSISGSGRSTGEGIGYPLQFSWASLVAQLVKNLFAMWEMWVQSLG